VLRARLACWISLTQLIVVYLRTMGRKKTFTKTARLGAAQSAEEIAARDAQYAAKEAARAGRASPPSRPASSAGVAPFCFDQRFLYRPCRLR